MNLAQDSGQRKRFWVISFLLQTLSPNHDARKKLYGKRTENKYLIHGNNLDAADKRREKT